MGLYERLADGEAEADAVGSRRVEWLEQHRNLTCIYADAVVQHSNLYLTRGTRRQHCDRDAPVSPSAVRDRLHRISDQIYDDLLDLHPVAVSRRRPTRQGEIYLDLAGAGLRFHEGDRLHQHDLDVEGADMWLTAA